MKKYYVTWQLKGQEKFQREQAQCRHDAEKLVHELNKEVFSSDDEFKIAPIIEIEESF